MKVEVKKFGSPTTRNTVLVPLKPDYILDTDVEFGDDIYIAYGKKMIVICKDLNVVNKLAEKDLAIIIDNVSRRKGKTTSLPSA